MDREFPGAESIRTKKIGEKYLTPEDAFCGLDATTKSHSLNVGMLAASFAKIVFPDWKPWQFEVMATVGKYHDIGKLMIPASILDKPDKLDSVEREIIRSHPQLGVEIIDFYYENFGTGAFNLPCPVECQAEAMRMVRDACLYHHERVDGSGYSHGIISIPPVARLCSVADVYDAVTAERPYHRAISHEDAMQILLCAAGTQLDQNIVLRVTEAWERGDL